MTAVKAQPTIDAATVVAVIGTAEDCDIRITDEYASPHHALIGRDRSGRYFVEDLGSTNGTRIAVGDLPGVKVRTWPLSPGNVIIVGRTRIPYDAPPNLLTENGG